MRKSPVYLTKIIVLLSFVSLFTDIASEMLYPIMPIYLESIGFTVLWIGVLEGVAEAVAGLSKGYFGKLSDHTGKRVPFVRLGYLLSAVAKPLMGLFIWPLWVALSRTLDRLGKGVRTGARDAIISDSVSSEYKGRAFGFHRGMDTLGAAIGPILALLFLYFYPGRYRLLLFLAFVPGLAAIVLTRLLPEKKSTQTGKPVSKVRVFSFLNYIKKGPSAYRKLLFGLLGFAFFNSTDMLLLLALKTLGVADTYVIGIYISYNLVYAIVAWPAGMLGDRIGLKRVFIIGLVLFAVVYAGMAFSSGLWMYFGLFCIYGVYTATTEGIAKAWICNIVPKTETATAIGSYSALNSVMAMVASAIGGLIWSVIGLNAMLLYTAIGVLLVIFYFVILKPEVREAV
jgi:MFS family permease